jgi:hypothetical protein
LPTIPHQISNHQTLLNPSQFLFARIFIFEYILDVIDFKSFRFFFCFKQKQKAKTQTNQKTDIGKTDIGKTDKGKTKQNN